MTQTAQVDAQSEEWFASYAETSIQPADQRRRVRHQRRTRESRRKRLHRINTLMMCGSVVLVAAMTACFYAVLTR
jgi:hypothetical protein